MFVILRKDTCFCAYMQTFCGKTIKKSDFYGNSSVFCIKTRQRLLSALFYLPSLRVVRANENDGKHSLTIIIIKRRLPTGTTDEIYFTSCKSMWYNSKGLLL